MRRSVGYFASRRKSRVSVESSRPSATRTTRRTFSSRSVLARFESAAKADFSFMRPRAMMAAERASGAGAWVAATRAFTVLSRRSLAAVGSGFWASVRCVSSFRYGSRLASHQWIQDQRGG
jgi:hypothetical protein